MPKQKRPVDLLQSSAGNELAGQLRTAVLQLLPGLDRRSREPKSKQVLTHDRWVAISSVQCIISGQQ